MSRYDDLPGLFPFFYLLKKEVTAFLSHLIGLMSDGCKGWFHIIGMKLVGITDQGNIGRDAELMLFNLFHGSKSQCVVHCQDGIRRFRQ